MKWNNSGTYFAVAYAESGDLFGSVYQGNGSILFGPARVNRNNVDRTEIGWHGDEIIISWSESLNSGAQLYVQKLNLNGEAVTEAIEVADEPPISDTLDALVPKLAIRRSDNTTIVAWLTYEFEYGGYYSVRQLSEDLVPLGSTQALFGGDVVINADVMAISPTMNDEFQIVAVDSYAGGSAIYGQRFHANGDSASDREVLTLGHSASDLFGRPCLALDSSTGAYVMAADAEQGGLFLQPFEPDDNAIGSPILIDADATLSECAYSNQLVVLTYSKSTGFKYDLFVEVRDFSDGSLMAGPELVTDQAHSITEHDLDVALMPDGTIEAVMIWYTGYDLSAPESRRIMTRRFRSGVIQ